MSGIIEVANLSFGYTPASPILKNISFEVRPGTFLVIAGPNGAGKSTLLNLICGALKPQSGEVTLDASPIGTYSAEALAAKVAVVRQEAVPIFGFSVIETVLMARTPHFSAAGFESHADRAIVNDALELTDTARFAQRPLTNLSSGERQRVFIARALAQDSPILLLDEPTSFLDLRHQVDIYDLLKTAQVERGKTIVAVTHDINLAAQYGDEALLLGMDGAFQHGRTSEVFSAEHIKNVFKVQVFAGNIGRERFFIPLGKLAKDSGQINMRPNNNKS
jgi:iron complex transport system ATP-binding protein